MKAHGEDGVDAQRRVDPDRKLELDLVSTDLVATCLFHSPESVTHNNAVSSLKFPNSLHPADFARFIIIKSPVKSVT